MPISNLDLKHLRVFVAIAEAQNFSHAAKACGLAQSSVSAIVKQLEQELGVQLIDRTTRRVALSRAGQDFLPGARRLLSEFDRQIAGMRDLQMLQSGQIQIACVPSVAARLLPGVVGRMQRDFPKVRISVSEVTRGQSLDMLRTGEADLAVANEPARPVDFESVPILSDVFALVMRRDHPLARKPHIGWKEACAAGLVMMNRQTGIRLEIERSLPDGVLQGAVHYEASNPLTLLAFVRRGIGVAPLPSLAWPPAGDTELTVRPLVRPTVTRQLHLVHCADRSLTPAALLCHRLIREEAGSYVADW